MSSPAPSAPQTLSLSALTTFVRRVFALNLPEPVWVTAELAQANESRGHLWLTLVEKRAEGDDIISQLDAVVWASALKAIRKQHGTKVIRGLFQEGMQVRLRVTASFHERYGLKLVVEDVDPAHTIGELERRRQEVLERLRAEGVLARQTARHLRAAAQRIALISSETAAGLADFREQLATNAYGYAFTTQLYAAAMQGAETGREVMSRLRQINRRADDYDAVVLIRGGGGRTDLAAFDDEGLCRAIADCPLPVIVGIGHETDETLADRVAHTALKTPTAVASFLVDRLARSEGELLGLGRRIGQLTRLQLGQHRPQLDRLTERTRQLPRQLLRAEAERLKRARANVDRAAAVAIATERQRLEGNRRLLDALRPDTTLARGYALVSQGGRLITDAAEVKTGEVEVRLRAGRVTLRRE